MIVFGLLWHVTVVEARLYILYTTALMDAPFMG
jgi:hypothetical protein